ELVGQQAIARAIAREPQPAPRAQHRQVAALALAQRRAEQLVHVDFGVHRPEEGDVTRVPVEGRAVQAAADRVRGRAAFALAHRLAREAALPAQLYTLVHARESAPSRARDGARASP